MIKNIMLISINGKIFDGKNAHLPALDRGFLYGDSVYEATRTFSQKPFHWDYHLKRLYESAKIIHLPIHYAPEKITQELTKIIEAHPAKHLSLRVQISGGTNSSLGFSRELAPQSNNLVIYANELKENPRWWLEKGLKLKNFVSTLNKSGRQSKSGSYYENVMAYEEAKAHGFDDALIFNKDGFLLEGTTFNVWFIDNHGTIHTPSLELGLLDGITRQCLLKLFADKQIPVLEGAYTQDDLKNASEIFITSSSRFIVPVTQIENILISSGRVGHRTLKYLDLYLNEIKKEYVI